MVKVRAVGERCSLWSSEGVQGRREVVYSVCSQGMGLRGNEESV